MATLSLNPPPRPLARAKSNVLSAILHYGLALAVWSVSAGATLNAKAAVPPPSETPAKIVVSGRTSTAVDIKIVKVGKQVPNTYSGKLLANTNGFDWYVSEHYALKSQVGDDFSRHILEISELAYPHWVELIGCEPPDPNKRMAVIYAKNRKELNRAMRNDCGGEWKGGGGGITLWNNMAAYNYPSGTLTYHKRDLIIHENLHLLQGVSVLNRSMGTEGMTYSGAQHVYDNKKKQLTVFCFDRAPINNFAEHGVTALRKKFIPMQQAVKTLWRAGGGHGVMYTQFFLTDPDRLMKWRIWRDEFYAGKVSKLGNAKVMESIFGPLDKLNTVWEKWVKQRRVTFHHVDWGWEQDGNTIWAYGFPWNQKYWSQMDIQYAPGEKVRYDPLRMDYPAEPMPPIVGPVKRGVAEPSVGCVISGLGRSWGGFGLGVEGRTMCQVVLSRNQTLVIDGKGFGIARREIPLAAAVKEAAGKDGHRFGVTIQIKRKELVVTVRAGKPGAVKEMKGSSPIDRAQRERLMTKYMSMIGRNGYPRITPFIDDARKIPPDLTKPAPANRWRFARDKELYRLYRAAYRLGGDAPASLLNLKKKLAYAMDKDPAAQKAAVAAYDKGITQVTRDVRAVRNTAKADLAIGELLGARATRVSP